MRRLWIARPLVVTALGFLALVTALTVLPRTGHAAYNGPYMRWRSGTTYGGGTHYYGGGTRYGYGGGYRYYSPYRYRYGYPRYYHYPRSYVSFGFGFGSPYYCYDPYYYPTRTVYVEPAPRASAEIDVTNLPPAGCYYYDRFCDETFPNLDEYTDHLQDHDHDQTIEVVEKRSGNTLRTLEFVGGYWRVRQ